MGPLRIAKVFGAVMAIALLGSSAAVAAPEAGAVYLGDAEAPELEALGTPQGQPPPAPYVDDQDAGVTYTGAWRTRSSTRAIDGTYHQSRRAGNTANIPFDGGRVTVYYLPLADGGVLDVYLDGELTGNRIGSVNQSWAASRKSWALEIKGIPAGPHTLILRHRSGARVTFDAVAYRDPELLLPVDGAAAYDNYVYWPAWSSDYLAAKGMWNIWPSRRALSYRRGDTATFTFTGDTFILYFRKKKGSRSLGTIKVFVDGKRAPVRSRINQARGRKGAWWYWWAGFPTGEHTVRVKHARGKIVNLLGFNGFDRTQP